MIVDWMKCMMCTLYCMNVSVLGKKSDMILLPLPTISMMSLPLPLPIQLIPVSTHQLSTVQEPMPPNVLLPDTVSYQSIQTEYDLLQEGLANARIVRNAHKDIPLPTVSKSIQNEYEYDLLQEGLANARIVRNAHKDIPLPTVSKSIQTKFELMQEKIASVKDNNAAFKKEYEEVEAYNKHAYFQNHSNFHLYESFNDTENLSKINNTNINSVFLVGYNRTDNNTRVCTIDSKYLGVLENMGTVGLDEIAITDLFVFPKIALFFELIKFYELTDPKQTRLIMLKKIYLLYKIFNKKTRKGVIIKSAIELLYSHYETDLTSSVSIYDMMESMKGRDTVHRTLSILISSNMLIDILVFLNMQIKDGKVLYLKQTKNVSDKVISFDIDRKLATLLKTSYVSKISNQLRSEPTVGVDALKNIPWLNSSHIEYGLDD
jgi:hypothetical protein